MRRKDREVADVNEILEMIDRCDSCNLGLSLNDMPYIIPLNFGYEFLNGRLFLYFHSAKEGKKLDIISKNPKACFSMDTSHELVADKEASRYTMRYESVAGSGRIEILDSLEDKRAGIAVLMRHYAPGREFDFSDETLGVTAVLKLTVEEFSGKRNKK